MNALLKSRGRLLCSGIAALLVSFPTQSLAQAKEPRALRLFEALSIALEQNRDVHKAEAYREWVEGAYLEARSEAFPQFNLSAGAARMSDESLLDLYGDFAEVFPTKQNVYDGAVSVKQPLYTWGKIGAALRAAKVGRLTADDRLKFYRQAAMLDVSIAFYDVLLAKELAAIARQDVVLKERHLDEARRKYELGTATDYDVLAAQVSVQNARPLSIRADNLVRTARDRLRFLLAEEGEVDAVGELVLKPDPLPDYQQAFDSAVTNRPDLKELEHTVGVQREVVKIARAGNKPRVDFRADLGYRHYALDDISSSGRLWSAGVYLSFPFFDGFATQGREHQAHSDLRQLEIDSEKLKDSISLEVRTALDAVQEAEEIARGLAGTVKQAERLQFMSDQGFQHGVMTRLDVEDAQLNVLQSRGNLARAHRDYLVARTALDWVMGVLER